VPTTADALLPLLPQDFITPLIAAIFAGSDFNELAFTINGSSFKYGNFINAFITFLFVVLFLWLCVVVPLEKLQYAAFRQKAIRRDCPHCLEEISVAATRCKHCCADVPLDAAMQHTLQLATAAMDAAEAQRQQRWYMRMVAPCASWCCQQRRAGVAASPKGEPQLRTVSQQELASVLPRRHSSGGGSRVHARPQGNSESSQARSTYTSPQQSFSTQQEGGGGAAVIDIEQLLLEQGRPKSK
jgi:large conductance mechanosensitive channel